MTDDEQKTIEALKNVRFLKDINDALYDIKNVLSEIADTLSIGLISEHKIPRKLSKEDSLIFAKAIIEDREPNEKLKELFSKDNKDLLERMQGMTIKNKE